MKIYVAAMKALRRKERQDETQFTTKIDGFLSLPSPLRMLMYFFAGFFLNSPGVGDQTHGSGAVFSLLYR